MVVGIFCGISWKRSRHLLLFSSDILTDLKDMMTISQLENIVRYRWLGEVMGIFCGISWKSSS